MKFFNSVFFFVAALSLLAGLVVMYDLGDHLVWQEGQEDGSGQALVENPHNREDDEMDARLAYSDEESGPADHRQNDEDMSGDQSRSIHLSPETINRVGLRTEILEKVDFRPELKAFGRVIDIEPMISLRLSYDKARLSGSRAVLQNIRTRSELEWGKVLSAALLDEKTYGRLLKPIFEGRHVLVQVTLPLGETLKKAALATLYRNGEETPIAADYISPSPRIDPVIQGETHFYHAPADRLRIGMALDVAVMPGEESLPGVFIPERAVIWRDGQAWVYFGIEAVPLEDNVFGRFVLPTEYKAVGGWFVPHLDWVGREVVVVGAQMLLSEEFRAYLDADDDD